MIDKQKQFHDAIVEGCEKEAELRHVLADSSLLTRVDDYLGTPKIAPLTFFLLMGSLILGLLLFDVFLPSLDTYFVLGWGVALSVTMFLYNSYATLAISLCLAGIFSLVAYSEQPLLCFIGILSLVLGLLAIWRFLKWFDKLKGVTRGHAEGNKQMKLISKDYAKARQVAYAFQVILGILSVMVLDNGFCFRIFINSMAAYWVCYFIITLRRPDNPSNIDIIFLAWSFPVICIFIAPIVSIFGLALYSKVFGLLN